MSKTGSLALSVLAGSPLSIFLSTSSAELVFSSCFFWLKQMLGFFIFFFYNYNRRGAPMLRSALSSRLQIERVEF